MKPLVGLLFVVLLLAVGAAADIEEITDIKDIYNYGDEIDIDYTIHGRANFTGLIAVQLYCSVGNITYYTSPIEIDDSPFEVDVPGLEAGEDFNGACTLKVHLLGSDGRRVESRESGQFSIRPALSIQAELNKKEILPGESFDIEGKVSPSYGMFQGTLSISFLGVDSVVDINGSFFRASLTTGKNVAAGEEDVLITAADDRGNYGEIVKKIEVLPVPSALELELQDKSGEPGDSIRYVVRLLDQAGAELEGTAAIKIEGGGELFTHTATLSRTELFQIPQGLEPGKFVVSASSADLEQATTFRVNPQLKVTFALEDGQNLAVKNIGNVEFSESLVVGLLSADRSHTFSKKLSIQPGESQVIDLFQEAPTGTYTVSVKAGNDVATFQDVFIRDERGFSKKVSGFFSLGESDNEPSLVFKIIALAVVVAIAAFAIRTAKKRTAPAPEKPEIKPAPEPETIKLTGEEKKTSEEEERAKQIIEKKQQQEMARPAGKLDRESPEVKRFLENLDKNKPFK